MMEDIPISCGLLTFPFTDEFISVELLGITLCETIPCGCAPMFCTFTTVCGGRAVSVMVLGTLTTEAFPPIWLLLNEDTETNLLDSLPAVEANCDSNDPTNAATLFWSISFDKRSSIDPLSAISLACHFQMVMRMLKK